MILSQLRDQVKSLFKEKSKMMAVVKSNLKIKRPIILNISLKMMEFISMALTQKKSFGSRQMKSKKSKLKMVYKELAQFKKNILKHLKLK
jgi:hypothetical protein